VAVSVVVFPVAGPVFDLVGQSNSHGLLWALLRSDLDLATAPKARAELNGLLAGGERPGFVLVYLGVDRFVDLRGLRVLVEIAASMRISGGELVVVAPPPCVRTIVELTGVGTALSMVTTPWHANELLKSRGAHPVTHSGPDNC
jgi:anti-anti-sigma factor